MTFSLLPAREPLLLSLAALALAAPGLAAASSVYHAAGGEVGFTTHPDHLQAGSNRQRSEVRAEIDAPRRDGSLALLSRGIALPAQNTDPAKTREQVRGEFLGMTDAEKRRLQERHGAGG
ncbi:MAG: DUF4148 domain-containing protein [Pseudomonadota bacterium]